MEIKPSEDFENALVALNEALAGVEGVATIFGREKSRYSKKQKLEDLKFKGKQEKIFDKIAFTIVLDNCNEPNKAVRKIFERLKEFQRNHQKAFKPLRDISTLDMNSSEVKKYLEKYEEKDWPYRVHDYTGNNKKENGYSSFHCGFMFGKTSIEIHIETRDMFMENNFGSADHNGIYKSRPSTYTCHQEILDLFETLHTNDYLTTKFIELVKEHDSTENEFFNHFSELLKKFNLNLNELINQQLTDQEIFNIVSNITNRYLLHDFIINSNNADELRINLKKYISRFHDISFDDFLNNSLLNYCQYIGIKIEDETTEGLLKECISHTNPILYRIDDENIIPTNKDEINRIISCYEKSVIKSIKEFLKGSFQK